MNLSTIVPIIAAIITAVGAVIAATIGARKERKAPRSKRTPAQRAGTPVSGIQPKEPDVSRRISLPTVFSLIFAALFFGSLGYLLCRWISADGPPLPRKVEIKITHLPPPGTPGTGSHGELEGTVSGSFPSGAWVLVYACANAAACYIQPFDTNYKIYPLNGKWNTTTHLGDRYVALLVAPDFKNPPAEAPNPPGGEGVLASDEKRSGNQ